MNGLGTLLAGLVGNALLHRMTMQKGQADTIQNAAGVLGQMERMRERAPWDERTRAPGGFPMAAPGPFGPSGGMMF